MYSGPWWWIFSWTTCNLRKLFTPDLSRGSQPLCQSRREQVLVTSPWQARPSQHCDRLLPSQGTMSSFFYNQIKTPETKTTGSGSLGEHTNVPGGMSLEGDYFPQQSWDDAFTSYPAGRILSVLWKVTFSHRMWPLMLNFHTSVFTPTLKGSWDSYHRLSFGSELLLSLICQLSDIITDIVVKPV